jgi:hypothetical protein
MRTLSLAILIVSILTGMCYADVEVRTNYNVFSDERLDSGKGFEVRIKRNGFFIFGSHDSTFNRFAGQEAGDVEIYGAGVGVERHIFDGMNVWLSGGWYYPESTMDGRIDWKANTANAEAMMRELDRVVGEHRMWDYYEYKLEGDVGFSGGLDFVHSLTDSLLLKVSAAYRWLTFDEALYGRDDPITDGWWEVFRERDFSGALFSLGLEYQF